MLVLTYFLLSLKVFFPFDSMHQNSIHYRLRSHTYIIFQDLCTLNKNCVSLMFHEKIYLNRKYYCGTNRIKRYNGTSSQCTNGQLIIENFVEIKRNHKKLFDSAFFSVFLLIYVHWVILYLHRSCFMLSCSFKVYFLRYVNVKGQFA